MELPRFKYHPDPLATGSIKPSDAACACCGQARGFVYVGPVYSFYDLHGKLCPWCIASGEANRKCYAVFGSYHEFDDAYFEFLFRVLERTPGFDAAEDQGWWQHCGDAAAYLGTGRQVMHNTPLDEVQIGEVSELLAADSESPWGVEDWRKYFQGLCVGVGVEVYVFRCLHCHRMGGFFGIDLRDSDTSAHRRNYRISFHRRNYRRNSNPAESE